MKSKLCIYILVLVAYSASLTHNLLPHAHYRSFVEFLTAGSSDQHKDHEHGGDKKTEDSSESPLGLFFFSHLSNLDVAQNKFSFSQKVKVKILEPARTVTYLNLSSFSIDRSFLESPHIFVKLDDPVLSSRALRAPPSLS